MRYFEAECLDGNNLVGYGRGNAAHTSYIKLLETEEEKMEHMKGMYKTSPKAFAEGRNGVCMHIF